MEISVTLDLMFNMESKIVIFESNKLNSKEINNYILNALTIYNSEDIIPCSIKEEYNFLNRIDALYQIHKPTSSEKLKKAINTLKYE